MTGPTHPQTQATARNWTDTAILVTLGVTAGIGAIGAIIGSFVFLMDFAEATGWPVDLAVVFPLCIDALGASALLIYAIAPKQKRAWPRGVAIGAIVASMLANAASHWFTAGILDPGWIAYTLSGFVPAISIGLMIHLITANREYLWAPNTSPTPTDAATDHSASSNAGSTATPPKRSHPKRRTSQPSTTGNAPAAANSAGTDPTTWTSFHGWTRAELQGRSTAQLLQWIKDQELERASLKDLQTLGRLSQRRAQELKRSLVTSNASTSHADSEPAADNNGWH